VRYRFTIHTASPLQRNIAPAAKSSFPTANVVSHGHPQESNIMESPGKTLNNMNANHP
jgi:hypothetical protein